MQYDTSPAWSLAPRHRKKPLEQRPGPGQYDPLRHQAGTGGKLGSEPRKTFQPKASIVGPGSYDPSLGKSESAPSFGYGQRHSFKPVSQTPGPAAYQPASLPAGPSYGMTSRKTTTVISDAPGPGQYQREEKEITPLWSFGKEGRGKVRQTGQSPGPANYDPKISAGSQGGKFAAAPRKGSAKEETVGPGAYDLPSDLGQVAYSLGARHPTKRNSEKRPGPGEYSPVKQRDGPQYSLAQASRQGIQKTTLTPGPGQYDLQSPPAPTAKFGSDTRDVFAAKKGSPGPATYTLPSAAGPQFTMQGRGPAAQILETPGPAHYDQNIPQVATDAAPNWSFAKDSKGLKLKAKETPGPANYDPQRGADGPQWGFGSANRGTKSGSLDVGPGSYDLPSAADKTAYTLTSRHPAPRKEVRPGPADYNPAKHQDGPQYSLSQASRKPPEKAGTTLGPGQYDPPSQVSPTAKFGTETRDVFSAKKGTPGPADYNPAKNQDGPQYSLSQASRKSPHRQTSTPGPGQYDLLSQGSPTVKFGSETRSVFPGKSGAPGPGTYTIPNPTGPKYTMQGKGPSAVVIDAPGPGHYNQHSAGVVCCSPTGFNFGSEVRSQASVVGGKRIKEGVGPGMYYKELPPAPPYYSFGHQRRGKGIQTGPPGPGQYDIPTTIAVLAPYVVTHNTTK